MKMKSRFSAAAVGFSALATSLVAQEPPFGSTADTVFDIIAEADPTTFQCLVEKGTGPRQIWDKRVDGEPVVEAFLFDALFSDGTGFEIAVNPEFGTVEAARDHALQHAYAVGQLPTTLRAGIERFSIHGGREGFHAGTGGIVVYAGMSAHRASYAHLEESLFHEAVHASWDADHRLAPEWLAAQQADGRFLTDYAASRPEREDLAETALFAFAILHHPDRFPPADTDDVLNTVPNRLNYIREILLPPDAPLIYQHDTARACP